MKAETEHCKSNRLGNHHYTRARGGWYIKGNLARDTLSDPPGLGLRMVEYLSAVAKVKAALKSGIQHSQ